MTTNSPTTSPSASGHVTIVFTSDWGVSTGVGQAGRTHSTIERSNGKPVVRGTVITGVLREQAMLAAKALDGPTKENDEGKWTKFALWLFGQDPDGKQGSTPHPRHVLFSDATPASTIPIHDTVSLSIDPQTGTARDQFLRFTERSGRRSSRARSRSSTRPGRLSPIRRRSRPRTSSWGSRASWSEASARAAAEATASARWWSATRTT